jgi:taurine transport system substrate-binding protein
MGSRHYGTIIAYHTHCRTGTGGIPGQAVNVTVAYQTSAEPAKVAQADNTFAKASGATVDWRKFDSGSSIVRALASGDVQIGNLGSSPLAVAATQQVPIEVFLLASKLGNSEALVVKKSISKPQDLIGKRIAVPFISTTHYSLLSALKHWGIKPGQVQIINLQPPAIIAAWQRGDIDGAYVWAPAVNELEKEGKVLTDSSQVGSGARRRWMSGWYAKILPRNTLRL